MCRAAMGWRTGAEAERVVFMVTIFTSFSRSQKSLNAVWVLAAGVPTVPGSNGLVKSEMEALEVGVPKVISVGKISARSSASTAKGMLRGAGGGRADGAGQRRAGQE